MRKSVLILGGILLIGIAVVYLFDLQRRDRIVTEVVQVPGGYGYLVKSGDKILIRQEMIPSIQKTSPFCTYNDAKAVASLVRQKIIKKEIPAITKEELKALHVRINCLDLAN
ncbi:DUF4907 domain-containing protein [Sinomicrobium pectinilyticum]|nr:DUF4907 domain-containing protein [Sinomicrobium pectinilyticum]